MNSVHEQCQRIIAQTVHSTVQCATGQLCRACNEHRSQAVHVVTLYRALLRHKPHVATWEIPYSNILCRDRKFSIATESLENSVAIENSLS